MMGDDKMAIKGTCEQNDLLLADLQSKRDRVGSLFMAQKSRDNWSARTVRLNGGGRQVELLTDLLLE